MLFIMKPILLDLPMPIITPRLLLRPPQPGDGIALNAAVSETCDIDNVRSKKIPQRLGFQLEGTLKANRLKPLTDEVSDTVIFARYDVNNALHPYDWTN